MSHNVQKHGNKASNISNSNDFHLLSIFWLQIYFISCIVVAVFFEPIESIVRGWFTTSYSYGFLIFCMSIYMIWIQRDILKQYTIHPAIIRGSMVTFLGCLMLVSGKLTNTQSLQHFALIVTLLGIIWLLLGTNYLKILVFPIGYLVFMFPLFGMILGKYSLFFQTTSASIAAIILNFFGMPVFRNGCILNLPHITLEVVKVCSGVHHIIALVSVAVPLAWITQKTHLRKLILIVLSFLIGLSANGFRIALIGFWTYFQNDMAIHGPASTLLISVFVFGPGLIVLIAVAVLLNKIPLRIISTNSSSITKNNNVTKDLKQQLNYRPTLIICCLFLITAIFMYLYNPKPVYLSKNLDEIPKEIGLWKGVNVKLLNEPFESYDPAISLKRVYEDGSGNKLKLYIGYFPIQSKNKEIFNSHYDILFENKKK